MNVKKSPITVVRYWSNGVIYRHSFSGSLNRPDIERRFLFECHKHVRMNQIASVQYVLSGDIIN